MNPHVLVVAMHRNSNTIYIKLLRDIPVGEGLMAAYAWCQGQDLEFDSFHRCGDMVLVDNL